MSRGEPCSRGHKAVPPGTRLSAGHCSDAAESLVPGGTKPCLEPSAIYVTQGSVFGLLSSITGSEMPGRGSVEAHRGSRSTIVFQIPKHAIDKARPLPCSVPLTVHAAAARSHRLIRTAGSTVSRQQPELLSRRLSAMCAMRPLWSLSARCQCQLATEAASMPCKSQTELFDARE